ncbi:GGDEF domain-containing protein [Gilvimarinus sp. SDUM040013]|uniref:diguanylate cyclase n=1 Tax=Gilvimarinus gilvus TaxID=3058038 RepID=A0ABU4S1Z5_9GAMM|nr:GGDEF domain-containing protein [Gilvimarinus sp. SDUM040013]MDO3385266.1 GGDEF domain-containing protein [Gilvimarinus sp. SDUM040013]MDX6849249.1 GGDEF domain-containing protein [Gilvimarinus sp. SDUM040013]
MSSSWQLEKTLLALVLLTALAILARERLLLETLVVEPGQGYEIRLYDDHDAGGSSEVKLLPATEEGYQWQCDLKASFLYPYCGFEIRLVDAWQGLDLSRYRQIELNLEYSGPNKTVRLFLRNFDPRYSQPSDDTTTKYNQVEFAANPEIYQYEFSFSDFFVANWWLLEKDIPPRLSHPQFNNVTSIDIQTGSAHQAGLHQFRLKHVKLVGQRFDTADWYLGIILCWAVIILSFLAFRVYVLTQEVRERKVREHELLEVNALLDSRSQELETLAKTDSLTGAFNRQGIEEAIKNGLYDWRRDGKALSIVMMDIDHFKSINDTYGHGVGDAVLAGISQLVQSHIRSSDLFARWGGEEFVLVCRNTRINYAAHIAEKFRRMVAESEFEQAGQVTASFGVATLRDKGGIDELFRSADEALYRAKERGRNRVELAGSL